MDQKRKKNGSVNDIIPKFVIIALSSGYHLVNNISLSKFRYRGKKYNALHKELSFVFFISLFRFEEFDAYRNGRNEIDQMISYSCYFSCLSRFWKRYTLYPTFIISTRDYWRLSGREREGNESKWRKDLDTLLRTEILGQSSFTLI